MWFDAPGVGENANPTSLENRTRIERWIEAL